MRYRSVSIRYALAPGSGPRELGDPWLVRMPTTFALPSFRPRVDIYEGERAFSVRVELAGVDADDLDIVLFEDAVLIEGRRLLAPPLAAEGHYHVAEIPQGPLRLAVHLRAPIVASQVEGRYERGLLELTLPKAEG